MDPPVQSHGDKALTSDMAGYFVLWAPVLLERAPHMVTPGEEACASAPSPRLYQLLPDPALMANAVGSRRELRQAQGAARAVLVAVSVVCEEPSRSTRSCLRDLVSHIPLIRP
jgi:hypothetical protein